MKEIIYILSILILMFSCQEKSTDSSLEQFHLTGKTSNIPDGTILYLLDIPTHQVFDSVIVNKNSFQIKRILSISPSPIYLHTKDYSEAKSFWIENNSMTFDATNSSFERATITGSKTETEFEIFLERIDTIEFDRKIEATAIEFVKQYPDSRFSASMLAGYSQNLSVGKVKELFDRFSKENKESVYGLKVAEFIELNSNHEIGDMFTDFEMKNVEGETIKLSQNLGRVTLLEFWSSSCLPNPDLVKTYRKYNNSGFEIFSVSLDFSKDEWKEAIRKNNLTWQHVSDLKGRNSTAGIIYGVNGTPDNFLIDKNGKIIAQYLSGEKLNEAIEKELNDK